MEQENHAFPNKHLSCKIFIIVLLLILPYSTFAQDEPTWPEIYNAEGYNYWEMKDAFYEWYNVASQDSVGFDTIHKTPHYKHFRRFESHYEDKLDENGTFDTYTQKMQDYLNSSSPSPTGCSPNTAWQFASFEEVPPNSHWCKGMGYISDVWVNPNNNQHILAGSNSAGLWKTTDGGQNWENITDTLGLSFGISCIAVDPSNYDIIYLGTGFGTATTGPYGYGILKSTDGGVSWDQASVSFNGIDNAFVEKIIIHPDTPDIAYAICNRKYFQNLPNGIYRTDDGFQTHTSKYIYYPTDIAFQPGNPQTVYLFGRDSLHRTIDGGQSWQGYPHTILDIRRPHWCVYDGKFATHDSLPNLLAVHYQADRHEYEYDNGVIVDSVLCKKSIFRIDLSHDKGMTWNNLVAHSETNSTRLKISFSPVDTSILYVNKIRLWRYNRNNNGGISSSYEISSNGSLIRSSSMPYWMHSDVRDTEILIDSNGNEKIYVAHDGGVSHSNGQCSGNYLCWNLITGKGLNITQYHGVAIHENDTNVFYGGAQDGNGAFTLDDGQTWTAGMRTDAGDLLLDHQNTNKRALFDWGKVHHYDEFGQQDGETPGSGKFGGRLAYHPNGSDTMYAGVNHLMMWDATLNRWAPDPICKISGSGRGNYVNAFSICESDPKNIIVASDTNTRGTTNYQNILFKTSVPNPDPVTDWVDITPHEGSLGWGQIAAIEVDPMDPNRIWIGFSFFGSRRIVYSSDGGATPAGWTDFSTGLPDLPIQEIHYQLGSNDLMYAATDVGIFYRNADMGQWECFSNGLPPGVANDIDVSYCTGRMIASVYGRGAWDNEILNIPWHVTSNTTWNENRWLSVDLHIDSGVVLTIQDTLLIYPDASIIVEKGGKLIVDGGHLLSACDNKMWQEIEVRGDRTLSQMVAGNQGVLDLKNAIIEDSRSVSMIKLDEDGDYEWDYTGGIIKAENTVFRNCWKAVEFLNYENIYNGQLYDNHSYFRDCTFETTGILNNGETPNSFVSLHEVDGIEFTNCTFRNTAPQLFNEDERGRGIVSWDATYSVFPDCSALSGSTCPSQNIQKCTFENLYYGIEARAVNPVHPFEVDYAYFDNCIRSIYQSGINYASTNRSEFNVPSPGTFDTYGIYLEQCHGYQVEENDFLGTSSPNSSGVCIYQSGPTDNEIYNNSFVSLSNGILVMSTNGRIGTPGNGLELLCNDFEENDFSIALTEEGIIDYHQGETNIPAGNTFLPDCIGSYQELFVSGNSQPYEYYHHMDLFTEPLCHSSGVVLVNTAMPYRDKATSCPSQLSPYPFCSGCPVIGPGFLQSSGGGGTSTSLSTQSLSLDQDQINSAIRYYLKDSILNNGLEKVVELLESQQDTMSKTVLAATGLRLGNQQDYDSNTVGLRNSSKYSSLIKVLDWKNSSSKIISPEIEKIAESKSFGSSHAKNAIALKSGKREAEILVYPEMVQKRLKTEEKAGTDNGIQLIPNPADKEVTLFYDFEVEGKREVSVFNSSGSIIFETTISGSSGKKEINTSQWANGMYLFKITYQDKTDIIKKLVISK